jgi:hypothetical protein
MGRGRVTSSGVVYGTGPEVEKGGHQEGLDGRPRSHGEAAPAPLREPFDLPVARPGRRRLREGSRPPHPPEPEDGVGDVHAHRHHLASVVPGGGRHRPPTPGVRVPTPCAHLRAPHGGERPHPLGLTRERGTNERRRDRGIEPPRSASRHPSPVLKTGPGTSLGRPAADRCIRAVRRGQGARYLGAFDGRSPAAGAAWSSPQGASRSAESSWGMAWRSTRKYCIGE